MAQQPPIPPLPPLPIGTCIQALGVDLVYLPRIKTLLSKYGERLMEKILTPNEKVFCLAAPTETVKLTRLASRIAVKEAVMKALKTGLSTLGHPQGITWQQIEIQRVDRQAPELTLNTKAAQQAQSLNISNWLMSTSHDGDYAIAMVLGLKSNS